VTVGGVFGGGTTWTVNAAGTRLKDAPVVLETCVSLTSAEPAAPDVTVTVLTSPQLPKVREAGLTVATDASLECTETTRVDDPVRLQPFLPSPLRGTTVRAVEPVSPPEVRVMTPAVPLRSFLMSSADAPTASSPVATSVPRIRASLPRTRVRLGLDTVLSLRGSPTTRLRRRCSGSAVRALSRL
jgi:hypothetical protein